MRSKPKGEGPAAQDLEDREVWGVFGGSFNPPHIGHLLLVQYLLGLGLVDQVLVLPCFAHAFGKDLCSFQLRCRWLRAMFENDARVHVTGMEASLAQSLGHAPRSLEVLEHLEKAHPGRRFRWVMGQDILDSGETAKWYRWEELKTRFDPIVIPRTQAGRAGPLPHISSSEIRIAWSDESKRDWLDAQLPRVVKRSRDQSQDPAWPLQASCDSVQRAWVLGQGKAGLALCAWLTELGVATHGVSGRALTEHGAACIPETLPSPSLVWLATRPDQSADALAAIKPRLLRDRANLMICSSSGAYSAEELGLAPQTPSGALLGTLHPMTSLTGGGSALHRCYFGWSGSAVFGQRLATWLGAQRLLDLNNLTEEGRLGYHAACALSSNYWAGVLGAAKGMFDRKGIGNSSAEPQASAAILELMRQSLENLRVSGIPDGVSGPLVRGQEEQVRAHQAQWNQSDAALHAALVESLRKSLQSQR